VGLRAPLASGKNNLAWLLAPNTNEANNIFGPIFSISIHYDHGVEVFELGDLDETYRDGALVPEIASELDQPNIFGSAPELCQLGNIWPFW
jgi:hypothetical protein